MNIPAGKIIIGLLALIAIILGMAIVQDASIPQPTKQSKPTSTPPTTSIIAPASNPQYDWEVTNLDYKVTEKNRTWWKFSWQATVRNNTDFIAEFFIDVNFVDEQGFIIEDDTENPPAFAPLEERIIKGYALIDTDIAPNVKGIELGDVDAYKKN